MTNSPFTEWLTREGLTLEKAAARLQVSKATVSKWAAGVHRVPPEKLGAVEAVTGIPRQALRPDIFAPVSKEAAQ